MPSQEEIVKNPLTGTIEVQSQEIGNGTALNSFVDHLKGTEFHIQTRNIGDEDQRRIVTRREDTSFHQSVELETCVHGVWKEHDLTPTTLLIFRCSFVAKHGNHRLKSITIRWKFVNDSDKSAKPSNPDIRAVGPYFRKVDESQDQEEGERKFKTDIGAGAAGTSWTDYNEKERRNEAVNWRFTQNSKKDLGVAPVFTTAILIRRQNDARFDGIFEITDFDTGALSQTWKFIFRGPKNEDDPIHFNPKAADILPLYEGNQKDPVNKKALGRLAKPGGISREYAWIYGVDLGED
ncbi:hypothetical protein CCUS01_00240 [Colletotrichum cuscutae]|uniref:Uncharacterized protein n=1 Tax=Colletotrichum cuscutae TaxID=1209917 RepID=A0AAJ0DQW9_9PEZI|nr:hypothetical protein CCUS01_00240 [Colletotrichum cuscutae]